MKCTMTAMMAAVVMSAARTFAGGPSDTVITYQGRLMDNGVPANGMYDMSFLLFEDAAAGSLITFDDPPATLVVDGVFTIELDFGAAAFDNADRWLQIIVEGNSLSPRQQITRTPYAVQTRGINVDASGNVGIGTTSPISTLDVLTSANTAIRGINSSTEEFRFGIYGETNAVNEGAAIVGFANNINSSDSRGVWGRNLSESGYGVHGQATNTVGTGVGVRGDSSAAAGIGVEGVAGGTAANGFGVLGVAAGVNAVGVWAQATHAFGDTIAIGGQVFSPNGYATYFVGGRNYFEGSTGIGTTDPAAPLHVMEGSAGVSANASTILAVESSAGGWISILTPDGSQRGILFGDSSAADAGGIVFDNNNNNGFQFRTGGNTTRMTILGTGDVGIGTSSPDFQLELSTNSAAKPTSNTWTIASDARLKKNIQPIDHALDDLLALRGVTYQWKDPASQGDMTGTYTGMIAQDVEKVFPEWITESADGYKHLTVIGFEGLAIEALRELRAEKDGEIDALHRENAALRERLAALENIVNEIVTREPEVKK